MYAHMHCIRMYISVYDGNQFRNNIEVKPQYAENVNYYPIIVLEFLCYVKKFNSYSRFSNRIF